MPRHCVDILRCTIEHFLWVRGHVEIVIICPDRNVLQAVGLQGRPDVVLDGVLSSRQLGPHLQLRPEHATYRSIISRNITRRKSRIRVERLILNRNRIDRDPHRRKPLNILDKVLCIRNQIRRIQVIIHRRAQLDTIQLHPPWRTPHGAEQLDRRIDGSGLSDQSGHCTALVEEVEVFELRVGCCLVVVGVGNAGEVGGADCVAHQVETYADVGVEDGGHQGCFLLGGESVECLDGCVGDLETC